MAYHYDDPAIWDAFDAENEMFPAFNAISNAGDLTETSIPPSLLQGSWTKQACIDHVVEMFPDISLKHVDDLHATQSKKWVDEALCQVSPWHVFQHIDDG